MATKLHRDQIIRFNMKDLDNGLEYSVSIVYVKVYRLIENEDNTVSWKLDYIEINFYELEDEEIARADLVERFGEEIIDALEQQL